MRASTEAHHTRFAGRWRWIGLELSRGAGCAKHAALVPCGRRVPSAGTLRVPWDRLAGRGHHPCRSAAAPWTATGRDKPVPYGFLSGIGIGNGVTLLPELSVILATPSFSTSSIRMTACMGTKLR